MEVQKTLPRQTGQEGGSVELAGEGCVCSIDPVYCISTVKNMRQVSSCLQGDKQLRMWSTVLRVLEDKGNNREKITSSDEKHFPLYSL